MRFEIDNYNDNKYELIINNLALNKTNLLIKYYV